MIYYPQMPVIYCRFEIEHCQLLLIITDIFVNISSRKLKSQSIMIQIRWNRVDKNWKNKINSSSHQLYKRNYLPKTAALPISHSNSILVFFLRLINDFACHLKQENTFRL